jgi:hypothetical protein
MSLTTTVLIFVASLFGVTATVWFNKTTVRPSAVPHNCGFDSAFSETVSVLNVMDDGLAPTNNLYNNASPVTGPGLRVNVQTRADGFNSKYNQVGYLSTDSGSRILPLYGRRCTRNNFQYYTISDTNFSIKLPILIGGRASTQDNGVRELSTGDFIEVQKIGTFSVEMYPNSGLEYIPF